MEKKVEVLPLKNQLSRQIGPQSMEIYMATLKQYLLKSLTKEELDAFVIYLLGPDQGKRGEDSLSSQ